jgi:uncharacterized integral membrane protein
MTNAKKVKLSIFAIIAILIVIIIFQNMAPVELYVLFWAPFSISKTLLLVITAFIGFIFGLLFKYIFFKKKNN